MKKLTTAADLGGAPIYKSDLRNLFNVELWDVIQGSFENFNTNTEGVVLQGCVTTNNGGNFDMTAGIVYLNGEFMRISAVVAAPFTRYIAPDTPVSDSRTFQDGSNHAVMVTKTASLYSSSPGSGQYLTISSLTDLDDRRWKPIVNQLEGVYSATGLSFPGGTASAGANLGIKKTSRNTLKMQGVLSSPGSGVSFGTPILALAVGFRPSIERHKIVPVTQVSGSDFAATMKIETNGNITLQPVPSGVTLTGTLSIYLDLEIDL